MPDLGKAYVQIVPSAQGIKGSITSVLGGEVSSAGEMAKGILGSKITLGALTGAAAIAKVGQEVAQFAAEAVQVGMGFDSSMSQVAATMGTTVDQIADLRDYAKEMGSTTAFSATQAAEALNYMALAGYDAETSMDMLPNVLNLAAAGGIQLARASDMITDAQSALGLSLEDTNVLVDQMARASSKSNTSVEQLGDAILTIGATARNIRGGTAELATVLGVLADNGIKGAEGGTHLRNILLSLQTPTTAGIAAMQQLGMTYDDFYDAAGQMRSIPEIMLELQGAMEGMSDQAKDAIISGIFNKTDLASVNALLGTSAQRFDELSAAIENSAGAAQAMADTQLDNLAGDVTLYKSAVEGLQIAVADKLNPALRFFVEIGTDVVTGLTNIIEGCDSGVPSMDELTRSTQAFYDTVDAGKANLDDTTTSIEATAMVADRYITALEGMGDTANMTAEEHQQYHNYLVLLTQTIPELAGIIDLETDSIDGGTAALHDNVDAWEKRQRVQAGEEYLAEVYQAQSDVLLEQAKNSVEATQAAEDLKAAETELANLQTLKALQYDAATKAAEECYAQTGELVGAEDFLTQEYYDLEAAIQETQGEIGTLTKTQDRLTQASDDNADAVAAAEAEIATAQATVDEYNRMLGETSSAASDAADGIDAAGEAADEAAAAMIAANVALEGIGTAAEEAMVSGGDLRAAYEDLSGQLDSLEGDLDANTLAMVNQQLEVLNLAATNQELTDSYPLLVSRLDGSVHKSLTGLSSWLIENGITAEEWGQQVTSATNGVVNGFQLLDTDLDMSLEDMAANLQQNITAHNEWQDNIGKLMDKAVEHADAGEIAFVQHMEDMGIGAAYQVALMAEDVDAALALFGPLFGLAIDAGIEEVNNSLENADVGTAASGIPQDVIDELEGGDYSGAGDAIASGVAGGVTSASGEISSAMISVVDSAVGSVKGTELVGPMKSMMSSAANVITSTDFMGPVQRHMSNMAQAIQSTNLASPMRTVMDSAVQTVVSTDFTTPGSAIPRQIAEGITWNSGLVSSAAQSAVNSAWYAANGTASEFYSVGYNMDQGMVNGLWAGSGAVQSAAGQVAQAALNAAKSTLKISSPSKVFQDEVGVWIPEGIAAGIRKGAGYVTKGVADLADRAVGAFRANEMNLGAYTMSARAAYGGTEADGKTVTITNNFTVSGAESPEDFADRLARRLNMQIRMA